MSTCKFHIRYEFIVLILKTSKKVGSFRNYLLKIFIYFTEDNFPKRNFLELIKYFKKLAKCAFFSFSINEVYLPFKVYIHTSYSY